MSVQLAEGRAVLDPRSDLLEYRDTADFQLIPDMDVERLQRALDYVTAHPEEWDQSVWAKRKSGDVEIDCGTACCLAGRVVANEGYQFLLPHHPYSETWECVHPDDPEPREISQLADQLLGFSDRYGQDDHDLYASSNTLRDLWWLADQYSGGRIRVPSQFQEAP